MAANTAPIFSGVGDIQWTTVQTAANTTYDGTLGTPAIAFSSSISGSFVQRIRFRAKTPCKILRWKLTFNLFDFMEYLFSIQQSVSHQKIDFSLIA